MGIAKCGPVIFYLRTAIFGRATARPDGISWRLDRAAEFRRDDGGGADRTAGVTGRGREIHSLERRLKIDLAVGDRVHRAAAGEREAVAGIATVQSAKQGEECFFVNELGGTSDVLVLLLKRFAF